jgi:hypothetical protein
VRLCYIVIVRRGLWVNSNRASELRRSERVDRTEISGPKSAATGAPLPATTITISIVVLTGFYYY